MESVRQSTSEIVSGLQEYWSQRSKSYSASNLEELFSEKRDVWLEILLENAPDRQHLKILDLGCGPGFFSMLMASAGHHVVAADVTKSMLRQAKMNADELGLDVEFEQIFGCNLPFEDNTFDLIINRNVVWNMDNPSLAFSEWERVLRPGGRTVYFDANWYLYLFDEELKKQRERGKELCMEKFGHDQSYRNITVSLEDIAKDLELSKEVRPAWDKEALKSAGLNVLNVDEDIYLKVWDEKEKILHAANPMFMVVAEKIDA